MSIQIKRAYDAPDPADGYRVLVDRIWPRGVSGEQAHVDLWIRDVAPSTGLREWFVHDPAKWAEFRERYEAELGHHGELLDLLKDIEHHRNRLTLVCGARDEQHNQAVVLQEVLKRQPAHAH